jgi:tetratricopeptide (TPR) repeat protein
MERENSALVSLIEGAEDKCNQRQCQEAIGLLEEAVRVQPANPNLFYQLGVCYSGACPSQTLAAPEMATEYLRHALSLVGPSPKSVLRARILNALGNTLGLCQEASTGARLREAIECHQEAAEIYRNNGLPDEWAREEYNLANVWCDLPEEQFPEKWAEAVKGYQNALQVRTIATDPEHHAATVMNLGTAFRQLPLGDHKANVMEAIRCYRDAQRVYGIEAFPRQYAEVCNNLGNACLSFPTEEEGRQKRHAEQAIRHFGRALAVWTCRKHPSRYALAQYNRGCAYLRLATSQENLQRAAACFSQAYDCARSCGRTEIADLAQKNLHRLAPQGDVSG